jgi:hypothetical protein
VSETYTAFPVKVPAQRLNPSGRINSLRRKPCGDDRARRPQRSGDSTPRHCVLLGVLQRDRYLFLNFHETHIIKGDDDMAPKKQEPTTEPKYPVIVKDPGIQRYHENGPNAPLAIEGVVVDKSLRDQKFKGKASWEEDKVYDLGVNPETGQVGFNPSRPMKPGSYSVSIESQDQTGPTTSTKFEVKPYGSGKKK